MQVATINEPRHVAREKYAEYLRAVKTRHSKEYELLKNAYRELSKGKQVIDLLATMQMAGTDNLHRPKFAICRADAKLCWFRWYTRRGPNKPTFNISSDFWTMRRRGKVALPVSAFDTPRNLQSGIYLRAVVPSIPPSLLPSGDLSKYHILWEAEWDTIPVDPMLLKHIGGYLYVVLAAWDLTPLEQAVLRGVQ